MDPRDIEINIGRMSFSGQEWGDPDGKPVIALHGWLDNAASFAPLAAFLDKSIRLIAIDQAGHGRSDHRAEQMDYSIWNYVEDVVDIADTLELESFSLLGHSMGAIVSTMTSAILGDRVEKAIMLDGLFPMPRKAEDSPAALKAFVDERKAFRKGKTVNRFRSMEHAVRVRCLGQFPVSRDSSAILVERALYMDGDAWTWRTDPRLNLPSPARFTEDQALAFAEQMTCESHMLYAKEGYIDALIEPHRERLANIQFYPMPGSHHFHMDGETEAVAAIVNTVMNT
ncbi:alpha/beta hydrolase [Endozoicomonas sp. OPT23]|uniref:alpha/beta fold hydrolase n=1 Tax=Endozoicomonas sp. OPT23 TaxID=2072845 RepID=UPI00129B89CA|nr:alpha/beta hydrolase [Endozoicomonas sp. OPT23]MRI34383.1 alpha/beta hydrolase [Endozoicomonas sp. OPT23]